MVRVTIIATGFDSVVDHYNINKNDELESNENQTNLFNDNIEFIQRDEEPKEEIVHDIEDDYKEYEDNIDKTELFNNLDNNDVFETTTTVTGYLSVDAKNQPSDIDTIVSDILNSRNAVSGQTVRECEMTTELDTDRLLYTFNFNFITI